MVGMKIIETHESNILSIWRLPMNCNPGRKNVVKLDILCMSCSKTPDKRQMHCMISSLKEIWHNNSTLRSVIYVSMRLDIYGR